jgi:hypothetical protein
MHTHTNIMPDTHVVKTATASSQRNLVDKHTMPQNMVNKELVDDKMVLEDTDVNCKLMLKSRFWANQMKQKMSEWCAVSRRVNGDAALVAAASGWGTEIVDVGAVMAAVVDSISKAGSEPDALTTTGFTDEPWLMKRLTAQARKNTKANKKMKTTINARNWRAETGKGAGTKPPTHSHLRQQPRMAYIGK